MSNKTLPPGGSDYDDDDCDDNDKDSPEWKNFSEDRRHKRFSSLRPICKVAENTERVTLEEHQIIIYFINIYTSELREWSIFNINILLKVSYYY